MQIENEYGAFGYDDFPRDTAYLESLKDALGQFGIESLLFTSDSPKGTQDFDSIPGGTYVQGVPTQTCILHFALVGRNMQASFGLKGVWES